jgi:hypothetical protein
VPLPDTMVAAPAPTAVAPSPALGSPTVVDTAPATVVLVGATDKIGPHESAAVAPASVDAAPAPEGPAGGLFGSGALASSKPDELELTSDSAVSLLAERPTALGGEPVRLRLLLFHHRLELLVKVLIDPLGYLVSMCP